MIELTFGHLGLFTRLRVVNPDVIPGELVLRVVGVISVLLTLLPLLLIRPVRLLCVGDPGEVLREGAVGRSLFVVEERYRLPTVDRDGPESILRIVSVTAPRAEQNAAVRKPPGTGLATGGVGELSRLTGLEVMNPYVGDGLPIFGIHLTLREHEHRVVRRQSVPAPRRQKERLLHCHPLPGIVVLRLNGNDQQKDCGRG
jgi:hypothetical protein